MSEQKENTGVTPTPAETVAAPTKITRRGRIENLTPWPKGVSGNMKGRPKTKPVMDELLKLCRKRLTKAQYSQLMVSKGTTWMQIALMGLLKAVAKGDVHAFDRMRETLDGPMEGAVGQSQPQVLIGGRIEDLEDGSAREQVTVITARYRERIAKRQQVTIDAQP